MKDKNNNRYGDATFDGMTYAEFLRSVVGSKRELLKSAFSPIRGSIPVKKDELVIKNIDKIMSAVLILSLKKGFQAMSMRDLSAASGLSTGALYSYFSSKEELLNMLLHLGSELTAPLLKRLITRAPDPVSKLRTAVRAHIYLSELLRPWFYFVFMESKNLSPEKTKETREMELYTEKLVADVLTEGMELGVFVRRDPLLIASLIKALQQDWYLKRWKYAKRKIEVEEYVTLVLDFIEAFCLASSNAPS